jgi:hypothetical protein
MPLHLIQWCHCAVIVVSQLYYSGNAVVLQWCYSYVTLCLCFLCAPQTHVIFPLPELSHKSIVCECVCVCVCVCVGVFVCMCAYVFVCMCVCLWCVCACVCACMCVCVLINVWHESLVRGAVHNLYVYMSACVCLCLCVYVCVCVCVCERENVCLSALICMYVCMYVCMYTCVYV